MEGRGWVEGRGSGPARASSGPWRHAAGFAGIVSGVLLAFGCALACAGAPERPPVVLITVDTLRADRLSCYGYFRPTSPHLDRLAAQSLLFENSVTPMATTLPAHISLMTSTSTQRHGIEANFEILKKKLVTDGSLRTLAETLSAHGYSTAAFVSATPLKRHSGIDAGFDVFDEPSGSERRASRTTDRVLEWLAGAPRHSVFLWVHYFDPHESYDPPPPFDAMFRDEPGLTAYLERRGFAEPHAAETRERSNDYDGEVRFTDQEIGRLLDALREAGMYDDAVVVVTGDHGEGLGQHGWISHGQIWNEQLFVPLLVKPPAELGIAPGRRTELASLLDVVPTLVDALDLPLGEAERRQYEGLSLLEALPRDRSLVAERVHRKRDWEPGRKYALLDLRWKYFYLTEGSESLHDMERDRDETRNVIAEKPEVAARMEARLLARLRAPEAPPSADPAGATLSDEVREELSSLGYVE